MSDAVDSISFVDPRVQQCPFAHYAKVRARHPVYLDPITGFYVLTGYTAVREATIDTQNYSSRAGQIAIREGSAVADQVREIYNTEGWMPVHSLVNNDPPDHARFRAFVERAFLPSRLNSIVPKIEAAVDRLIDGFAAAGRVEFMTGFASPLPLLIFGGEFGIPEADQPAFLHWSNVLLAQMDPVLSPERELALTREVVALQKYLVSRIEHYRASPAGTLLSDLVEAADARGLNTAELLSVIQMLVPAGHETTANALGSGMRRIAEQPALQARLRADRDAIGRFVEEVLRLDAPVQGLFRRAKRAMSIDGVTIPEGATVVLSWGAANRDPAKFPQPDLEVLDRDNARQHLSFGAGAHFCVGSQLARLEMEIAFHRLLERLLDIRLGPNGCEVRAHYFAYGPTSLDVEFTADLGMEKQYPG
jgi:cytochrome P450